MKIKQFLAGTLALLVFGNIHAKASVRNHNQNTSNREMIRTQELKTRNKFDLPFQIGGIDMISRGDGGIPPHLYGMYFVKRNSHKRSNK